MRTHVILRLPEDAPVTPRSVVAGRVIARSACDEGPLPISRKRLSQPRLSILVSVLFAGCISSGSPATGPSGSGSSFEDDDDDERETVLIEPKEQADIAYDVRPALFDTALIRAQDRTAAGALVEVLIKGYFPDGCSELNELNQEPARDGQTVSLTMRRPSDAICTQVVRPYRFFFTLDRRFELGRYVLSINGRPFSFEVSARR
ncbi:MAG TPA: hypothetical protein VJB15_04165 [Rhodothermia bacterium]|nr:hypothetical protein [Rhodothermia bacterium]